MSRLLSTIPTVGGKQLIWCNFEIDMNTICDIPSLHLNTYLNEFDSQLYDSISIWNQFLEKSIVKLYSPEICT